MLFRSRHNQLSNKIKNHSLLSTQDKKTVVLRLSLYVAEVLLIAAIVSTITIQIWAFIAGFLLAFILTTGLEFVVAKMKLSHRVAEVSIDKKKELASQIINVFPGLPGFIKDNVISLITTGENAKNFIKLRKGNTYRELMLLYIEGMKKYRIMQYNEASLIFKKLKSKASIENLEEIRTSAQQMLEKIPYLISADRNGVV